jgi:hypothetical protein
VSVTSGAANHGASIMSSPTSETSSKPKHVARTKTVPDAKTTSPRKATCLAQDQKKPWKSNSPEKQAQMTKQDRVLALLRRSGGASIEEIMQATDWQQHSVRGFLAGTVKKKLGLALTSSKGAARERRYRIEARRGR